MIGSRNKAGGQGLSNCHRNCMESPESTVQCQLHVVHDQDTVADSGGVRGVQMHSPLAASNVFLCT